MITSKLQSGKSQFIKKSLIIQLVFVLSLCVGGVSAAALLGSSAGNRQVAIPSVTPSYMLITESPTPSPTMTAEAVPESPLGDLNSQNYVPSQKQTRSDCSQLFMAYHDSIQAEVRTLDGQVYELSQQLYLLNSQYTLSQEFIDNGNTLTPAMSSALSELSIQHDATVQARDSAFQKHNIPFQYPGC